MVNDAQVIEIQDFEQPHGYGTSIICPSDSSQFLNIELPVLVVVIKNLNLHCRLQVQVIVEYSQYNLILTTNSLFLY